MALNWVVAKGAVPLPGVKTAKQAKEVVGCLGWRLRADDMEVLDEAVERSKNVRTQKNNPWDKKNSGGAAF